MNREILNTILKSVALAMGVAILVLTVLNKLDLGSAMSFFTIGLVCYGISYFNSKDTKG